MTDSDVRRTRSTSPRRKTRPRAARASRETQHAIASRRGPEVLSAAAARSRRTASPPLPIALTGNALHECNILPSHSEHQGRRASVSKRVIDCRHHAQHRRTLAGLAGHHVLTCKNVAVACGCAFASTPGRHWCWLVTRVAQRRGGWGRSTRSIGTSAEHERDRRLDRATTGSHNMLC